ncbi:hypothetical protein [Methylobacterium sp. E-066]|uniref:hypothetical protein n=1 Tax=Methylobacterium sp. E-066 TaxID=2836584 RepID=UPI001FB8F17C|nr:hypothetical protein [Methylobacterium sp. E-066]MCJ2143706.1 hypothetical protein [Methylobacterium sp. E-066]
MSTKLPSDILTAIEAFETAALWCGKCPGETKEAEEAKAARAVRDATILRHLPSARPLLSAEDAEALRMGGDR